MAGPLLKEADIAFHLFWTECNKIHDDVEGTALQNGKSAVFIVYVTNQAFSAFRAISAACEKREFYALLDGQGGDGAADGSCPADKKCFHVACSFSLYYNSNDIFTYIFDLIAHGNINT